MNEAPKTRVEASLFRLENDLAALRGDVTVVLTAQRAILLAMLCDDWPAEAEDRLAASMEAIERLLAIPGR